MSECIEKIDDTVLRLSIPQPHYIPSNVYLLVCKSPTLIDTGHPASVSGNALKHALNEVGYKPTHIKNVIFTHPHIDHMGGVRHLEDRDSMRFIAHQGTLSHPTDFDVSIHVVRNMLIRMRKKYPASSSFPDVVDSDVDRFIEEYFMPVGDVTLDKTVVDGELLHIDHFTLQVIHAPGHNPHHIVLWDRDRDWMYTGDVALETGTSMILGMGDSINRYQKTLERLGGIVAERNISRILPGHGAVSNDPKELIQNAGDQVETIKREIVARLKDTPMTITEILESFIQDMVRIPHIYALSIPILDTYLKQLTRDKLISGVRKNHQRYFTVTDNVT
ncbi:MAG: MBL fold metallo-hydrolase [Deltaproteobacteria bacterium]|nr:MBL fold metallo-hydrolase [Candidatus Zymogenaceae bacterium]